MTKQQNNSLARFFSFLASFFSGVKVHVVCCDDTQFVGYTSMPKQGEAEIVLSYTTPLYTEENGEPMTDERTEFMMLGVLAHETLHLVYTAFATLSREANKLSPCRAATLREIHNILEDPAIEYGASSVFGGAALNALDAIIRHTWRTSPPIDQFVIPGEEKAFAYAQVCSALIQLGDRGSYKGTFSSALAKNAFDKVLPLFNKGVLEPDGAKRVLIAKAMFDILAPLKSEEEQASDQAKAGAESTMPKKSMRGPQNPSMESDGQAVPGMPENQESGGVTERDSESTEPEQISEADLQELRKGIEKAAEEIKKEESAAAARQSKAATEVPKDSNALANESVVSGSKKMYDKIVAQYKPKIMSLKNALAQLFMSDTGGTCYSSHGAKIKISRVASPVLYPDIMVSRTAPKGLKDIALYLLVDESGSMSSKHGGVSNCDRARDTAICLYEALSGLNLPVYISGFTTNYFDCTLHRHYVTWNSNPNDKIKLTQMRSMADNYDYISIPAAADILNKHPAKHKILVVVSDGCPCTRDNKSKEQAIEATRVAIQNVRRSGISILGVALNCISPEAYNRMYGKEYIKVGTAEDMFASISSALRLIVKSW